MRLTKNTKLVDSLDISKFQDLISALNHMLKNGLPTYLEQFFVRLHINNKQNGGQSKTESPSSCNNICSKEKAHEVEEKRARAAREQTGRKGRER